MYICTYVYHVHIYIYVYIYTYYVKRNNKNYPGRISLRSEGRFSAAGARMGSPAGGRRKNLMFITQMLHGAGFIPNIYLRNVGKYSIHGACMLYLPTQLDDI